MDESLDRVSEQQKSSPNTRTTSNEITDQLAVSAIIVNDLREKRNRNYDFDWNKAVQSVGKSGIRLQYAHARLCSLLQVNHEDIGQGHFYIHS